MVCTLVDIINSIHRQLVTDLQGAAVLKMLEGFIGTATFRDGIRVRISVEENYCATIVHAPKSLTKLSQTILINQVDQSIRCVCVRSTFKLTDL